MELNTAVFDSFPALKTNRLLLRQMTLEDASAINVMRNDYRLSEFIARHHTQTMEETYALIEKVQKGFEAKENIAWAAVLRDGADMIGTCGFNRIDYPNLRAEIGGEMSTRYWGKGIAVEAVAAIVDFGIHILNLHSIEAKIWPGNRGAIHLLEHLGFKEEAHFKDALYFQDRFMDMAVYSLVA